MGIEEISEGDFKGIGRLFVREEGSIALILYLGKVGLTQRDKIIQELNIASSDYNNLIMAYKKLRVIAGDSRIDLTEKGRTLYDIIKDRLKEAYR